MCLEVGSASLPSPPESCPKGGSRRFEEGSPLSNVAHGRTWRDTRPDGSTSRPGSLAAAPECWGLPQHLTKAFCCPALGRRGWPRTSALLGA